MGGVCRLGNRRSGTPPLSPFNPSAAERASLMLRRSLSQNLNQNRPRSPDVVGPLATSILATSRGQTGFPAIAPAPIHRSSGVRTSGRQQVHPDRPPSFRHQKSLRLPANVLLTANRPSQKPRGESAFAPSPHARRIEMETNPSPLSSLDCRPAPPVSDRDEGDTALQLPRGLPSSPTCGTLVSRVAFEAPE